MRILMVLGSLYLCLGLGVSHAEPMTEADTSAPAKMAQLVIGRDAKVPDTCSVELSLEEKPVAELPAGESVKLDVPAGTHYLRAKLAPAEDCNAVGLASGQSILLAPGETREYQLMLDNDALFLAPQHQ
ncbi:hypothetical protein ACX0MV_14730 [Pseudomonas borbori]